MSSTKLRASLQQLQQQRRSLLRRLTSDQELAVGTVSVVERKCGNPACHCAKGAGGATDQGTRNLLELALEKEIKHFVHLSTTEVYGNVEGEIDENTPFQYTGNEYNKTRLNNTIWSINLNPSVLRGL